MQLYKNDRNHENFIFVFFVFINYNKAPFGWPVRKIKQKLIFCLMITPNFKTDFNGALNFK